MAGAPPPIRSDHATPACPVRFTPGGVFLCQGRRSTRRVMRWQRFGPVAYASSSNLVASAPAQSKPPVTRQISLPSAPYRIVVGRFAL